MVKATFFCFICVSPMSNSNQPTKRAVGVHTGKAKARLAPGRDGCSLCSQQLPETTTESAVLPLLGSTAQALQGLLALSF